MILGNGMAKKPTKQRAIVQPSGAQSVTGEPPYLTETDAAARSTLSARTLQEYRKKGGGPPYLKVGHRIVYRRDDLDRWMTGHAVSSQAVPS